MKKCSVNPELLSRLVDGDITELEEMHLRGHMGTCQRCAQRYAGYLRQRKLLNAGFSEHPLPVSVFSMLSPGKNRTVPLRPAAVVLATAAVVCMGIVLTGRPYAVDVGTAPVVILESQSPSTMMHPLSALAYYEEMAGSSVHSQFVALTPRYSRNGLLTDEGCVQAAYHESQIFFDNALQARSTAGQEAYESGE